MSVSASVPSRVNVDFVVKFGKETVEVTMPLTASMAELKSLLQEKTSVPSEKQRLLLNAPVAKERRRDVPESTTLDQLFPTTYLDKIVSHANHPTTTTAQHIKVTAMLIGSTHTAPLVNSKAAAEVSRLVMTTVERGGYWYRCSFGKGYLRQTAYVCRTCIMEGRADPDHAFCLACADMCHGNHEVEEWGVRYCMRCDCCTKKCWKTPQEGYTRMPRLTDQAAGGEDAAKEASGDGAPGVSLVTSQDVHSRVEKKKKRSRSSSPLTPKRTTSGHGGSPVSGVRVAAVASAPSPFSLQEPPPFETQAVASPVAGTLGSGSGRPAAGGKHADATSNAFPREPSAAASSGSTPQRLSGQQPSPDKDEEHAEGPSPTTATGASLPPLPEAERCMFVIDSQTGKPPVTAVLPANAKNRYPRNPLKWCYCEDDHPSNDPDCGGVVCILCTTCFWSDHMKRLYSDAYRRVPCYGDVVQGDTLAFKCLDCNTYVCVPCRLRCHNTHRVEPEFICPSREDGTDNGAPNGVNFSCGCRGMCSIAEAVPEDDVADMGTYMPMPPEVATSLMDNDVFTGFLCAQCMQENPWIVHNDPKHCYNGELPAKVTGSGVKRPLPCAQTDAPENNDDVFPWHGMILPVNSFTEDATCTCPPCRAAYEAFAPRATEDATEMIVELHDDCDNCGKSVRDQTAFMCQTCEMAMDKAFMLCKDCNALREHLVRARHHPQVQQGTPTAENNNNNTDGSLGGASQSVTDATSPPPDQFPQQITIDGKTYTYLHNLDHEFMEDTTENVAALAGMQMMQSLDAEALSYLRNNWDSMKDSIEVTSSLADVFGQTPLTFSPEELEVVAEENRRSSTGDTKASVNDNSGASNTEQPTGQDEDASAAKRERKE